MKIWSILYRNIKQALLGEIWRILICFSEKKRGILNKYTTEYFFDKIKENPNYEQMKILTTEIFNAKTRVKCECKKCGYQWKTTAQKLILRKSGCGRCHGAVKFDNKYFLERIKNENPTILPLESYINDRTPLKCRCLVCGNEWKIAPTKLHQGEGCPQCFRKKISSQYSKSHDLFVREMKDVDPTIIILTQYKNTKTKVRCKCQVCKHEWSATPANLLKYRGCPECSSSHGERRIHHYLKTHGIQYVSQKVFDECKDKRPLRFDFYLPQLNMVIEFDGEQHFHPVKFSYYALSKKTIQSQYEDIVRKDNIKNKFCKENDIAILRIPYWDYKNIEKILEKQIS